MYSSHLRNSLGDSASFLPHHPELRGADDSRSLTYKCLTSCLTSLPPGDTPRSPPSAAPFATRLDPALSCPEGSITHGTKRKCEDDWDDLDLSGNDGDDGTYFPQRALSGLPPQHKVDSQKPPTKKPTPVSVNLKLSGDSLEDDAMDWEVSQVTETYDVDCDLKSQSTSEGSIDLKSQSTSDGSVNSHSMTYFPGCSDFTMDWDTSGCSSDVIESDTYGCFDKAFEAQHIISDNDVNSSDSDSSSSDSDGNDDSYNSDEDDTHDDDEDVRCLDTCPCRRRFTPELPRIERENEVIQPLLKKLLRYRTMKESNSLSYGCCEQFCSDFWFHLDSWELGHEYANSDLHVMYFSWGTWKRKEEKEPKCPTSCVCNTGKSNLRIVEEVKRKRGFRVPIPLYQRVLRRQLLRDENRLCNKCCENRCALYHWGEDQTKAARQIKKDYKESDLSVVHYTWCDWKIEEEELEEGELVVEWEEEEGEDYDN